MTDPQIAEYVRAERAVGTSNELIARRLLEAGWLMHEFADIVLDRAPARQTGAAPAPSIIVARDVSKTYGKVTALDRVSLSVERGSVTALLGPNGAGKTTLVRIMTTLLEPSGGSVSVAGFDVVRDAQRLRSVIGLAGQYAAVDETLTGRENLEIVGRLYHLPKAAARERATELLRQFDLADAADRTVKTYSGGMRRRLDLAASLVIRPQILFLDEPTTGLDPRSRFGLWHVIRELVEDGTTVLLTTQYLEEADQLAKRIFVIDHGRIIAEGTSDELKRQVGGDVLELHLEREAAAAAAGKVARFGTAAPQVDAETGVVTMPVAGGASILAEVIRELDGARLTLKDVMLRRPSLDDVFMKLTGHGAE